MENETDPLQLILSQSQAFRLWFAGVEKAMTAARDKVAEETVMAVAQLGDENELDVALVEIRKLMLDSMNDVAASIGKAHRDVHAKVTEFSELIGVKEIFDGYDG